MYKLKKVFKFKSIQQAELFAEVASLYGKNMIFGTDVIYEAVLDFPLWRKLINFADIIVCAPELSFYTLTERAGLKAFKERAYSF